MTTISSGNIALTLLQGNGNSTPTSNAADTIAALAAGAEGTKSAIATGAAVNAKASAKVATTAEGNSGRAIGGTVSSVPTSSDTASLARIISGTTLAEGVSASGADWEATAAQAEQLTKDVVNWTIGYNAKSNMAENIDVNEVAKSIEAQRISSIASGTTEEKANSWAATLTKLTPARQAWVDMANNQAIEQSTYASYRLPEMQSNLQSAFGVSKDRFVTDESGQADIKAFDITSASGQKILSLSDDGTLTTFNQDGSVRNQLTRAALAQEAADSGFAYVRKVSADKLSGLY